MGSFLLLALLAVAGVFVVRMLLARRDAADAGDAIRGRRRAEPRQGAYETPPRAGVGQRAAQEPVMPAAAPATAADAVAKPLPPGFDADGFARQAKIQFIRLQAAYDAGDRDTMARRDDAGNVRRSLARSRRRAASTSRPRSSRSTPACSK